MDIGQVVVVVRTNKYMRYFNGYGGIAEKGTVGVVTDKVRHAQSFKIGIDTFRSGSWMEPLFVRVLKERR